MDVKKILKEATDNGSSDIFIVAGRPLTYKSKGVMECLNEIRMIPKEDVYKRQFTYSAGIKISSGSPSTVTKPNPL